MDLGIRGRVALCAGASAGMGRAAARALALEGVRVVMSARGEARLLNAARAIGEETGVETLPVVADHGTAEGRARLLAACPDPDILVVTCSPPAQTRDYGDVREADWTEALETAFVGPAELMRAVLPGMAGRGFGRVVNIATVAAKHPSVPRLLSGPTRAALANYAVAVSKAVAARGVTVNTLLPGMFATEALIARMESEAKAAGEPPEAALARFVARFRVPAGRFGDPDEAGALCAMLCSRFAGYVTGQSLVVDGGLTTALF